MGYLMAVIFLLIGFIVYQQIAHQTERQQLVDKVTAKEQDYLDRLMSKDLPEVKQVQSDHRGRVLNKRQNSIMRAKQDNNPENQG